MKIYLGEKLAVRHIKDPPCWAGHRHRAFVSCTSFRKMESAQARYESNMNGLINVLAGASSILVRNRVTTPASSCEISEAILALPMDAMREGVFKVIALTRMCEAGDVDDARAEFERLCDLLSIDAWIEDQ